MRYHIDDHVEHRTVRRVVMLGLFVAASLVCGLVESRFPIPFPGMRLGLSNVFYLTALVLFGAPEAFCVAAMRTAMLFVFTGNAFALACSALGLAPSLAVSALLVGRFGRALSLPAVSAASACVFNLGQLAAVVLMTGESRLFIYYPILMAAGVATGIAVGIAARTIIRRLERSL